MYFTREKSTYRIPGVIFNGILALYCILGTVLLLGAFAFFRIFHKSFIEAFLILAAVLFTEAALSAMTFIPAVSNGENSALFNLPLLAMDLMLVTVLSCGLSDLDESLNLWKLLGYNVSYDKTTFSLSATDLARALAFTIFICRYLGLAWTDSSFILKRLFAPLRRDTVKEYSNHIVGKVAEPTV